MFNPNQIFSVLANSIKTDLPPFATVEQIEGNANELAVMVHVLTPHGMMPLLKLRMSESGSSVEYTERNCIQKSDWYSDHWKYWADIENNVSRRFGSLTDMLWACQPTIK